LQLLFEVTSRKLCFAVPCFALLGFCFCFLPRFAFAYAFAIAF